MRGVRGGGGGGRGVGGGEEGTTALPLSKVGGSAPLYRISLLFLLCRWLSVILSRLLLCVPQ